MEERIVDLLTNLGEYELARTKLEKLTAGGMNFVGWMLDGALAQAEGLQLLAAGKQAEGYFKFAQYEQSVAEARAAEPGNIMPILHLMDHHMRLFNIERDVESLETALKLAAEAESIRPGDSRTSNLRVKIFGLQNRPEAAIAEAQNEPKPLVWQAAGRLLTG